MRPKNGRFTQGPRSFSAPPLVLFLGRFIRGIRFFSAFNAVLFCTFVVGRVVRAFGYVFVVFGRLVRRFGFAVSWLCECRLSHLAGGVNKKNTLPGGRPAKVEPAGACVRGAGKPQSGGQ